MYKFDRNKDKNGNYISLLFPDIVKRGKYYYLDWEKHDKWKEEKVINWLFKHHLKLDILKKHKITRQEVLDYFSDNNVDYCFKDGFDWSKQPIDLDGMSGYKKGILHYIKLARKEWQTSFTGETAVNNYCAKLATQSVDNAFFIIEDAIHMKHTQSYNYDRLFIKSLMLYKFWEGQTGGGLLIEKAFGEYTPNIPKGHQDTYNLYNKILDHRERKGKVTNIEFNVNGDTQIECFLEMLKTVNRERSIGDLLSFDHK